MLHGGVGRVCGHAAAARSVHRALSGVVQSPAAAGSGQRTHSIKISAHAMGRKHATYGAARSLSAKPGLDLDALMSANKYGGSASKPAEKASGGANLLDDLMSKNR